MQLVTFISHIVDFGVCEYACRVAIYRPDYNIYAPCNFVLCLGASKFGASNNSEIRTALPYQISNEDPKAGKFTTGVRGTKDRHLRNLSKIPSICNKSRSSNIPLDVCYEDCNKM